MTKGLFGFLIGILRSPNPNDIVTKKGMVYHFVGEDEIPNWVWRKIKKQGAEGGRFKGKKYRYIIQYECHGMYSCWKRKRGKK